MLLLATNKIVNTYFFVWAEFRVFQSSNCDMSIIMQPEVPAPVTSDTSSRFNTQNCPNLPKTILS